MTAGGPGMNGVVQGDTIWPQPAAIGAPESANGALTDAHLRAVFGRTWWARAGLVCEMDLFDGAAVPPRPVVVSVLDRDVEEAVWAARCRIDPTSPSGCDGASLKHRQEEIGLARQVVGVKWTYEEMLTQVQPGLAGGADRRILDVVLPGALDDALLMAILGELNGKKAPRRVGRLRGHPGPHWQGHIAGPVFCAGIEHLRTVLIADQYYSMALRGEHGGMTHSDGVWRASLDGLPLLCFPSEGLTERHAPRRWSLGWWLRRGSAHLLLALGPGALRVAVGAAGWKRTTLLDGSGWRKIEERIVLWVGRDLTACALVEWVP